MRDHLSDRFVRTHLKTSHMVLLVELGRHGSILRAAQAANMTQSSASKRLSELEYVLGVQLFERLARGISPTINGEVMIRRAGAALAEMDSAHQEVMELMSGSRGQVSVGTIITPSTSLVPRALTEFKASHPAVNVSVVVDTSIALLQQLRAGMLDVMIGRIIGADASAELKFVPLQTEQHHLVVRAGHPLTKAGDLTLRQLSQATWILPPRASVLRDRLTSLFVSKGLDTPRAAVETSAMPVIISLLLSSDFLVALPLEPLRHYLEAGLLVQLDVDLDLVMDAYGIVTRKQHRLSTSAQIMVDLLSRASC
ncbi:LysR family transcriptional regulator [Sapientia aquatica]|uniref:LysR family transcriptional regulator n=1 Tax=Sapientia aquatica TaxID=1549640 RepID=A0A4R5VPX7_9BURK|nr:LysR family transcriptional regulator [Sapientia aquatica]TDK60446.1 LysR family transcriptional regulator [Sapientia aquatica]